MLPEWWLQFDRRYLDSRAAAFAERMGHARALTPLLAGLEGRLSDMLERSGWLERFLVRGAEHRSGMNFAYEGTSSSDFQWLALEEEFDDLSEEGALAWLKRVAPSHPIVRRMQKTASENQQRTAVASSRRAGAPGAAPSARPTAKRGASKGAALPSAAQGQQGVRPAASVTPSPVGPEAPQKLFSDGGEFSTDDQSHRAPFDARDDVASHEGRPPLIADVLDGPTGGVGETSVPALSLGQIEGFAGAEGLSAVLRGLLGHVAGEVEPGVTPRELLRAMVTMRRSQGSSAAPAMGSATARAFASAEAERVWLTASDEGDAIDQGSAPLRAVAGGARRAAPSLGDVKFAEALSMSPGLRSLAGLASRATAATPGMGRRASRPAVGGERTAAAEGDQADVREVREAREVREVREARAGRAGRAESSVGGKGFGVRRMLGATALHTSAASPLLRTLLAGEATSESSIFDGAVLHTGTGSLESTRALGRGAERFSPVSFGVDHVLLQGADEAAREPARDVEGGVSVRSPSDGRARRRGTPRTATPGAEAARPSVQAAERPAGSAKRATVSSGGVAVPALVATLRRALEARESMSSNVEAFSHLAEAIAEGRARVAGSHAGRQTRRAAVEGVASAAGEADRGAALATSTLEDRGPEGSVKRRRSAAGEGLPIGFSSVLRSGGATGAVDSGGEAEGDVTRASRSAGTRGAAIRLSGLVLDENGVPSIGQASRSRAMTPLSDSLALLAGGEGEQGDVTMAARASGDQAAEQRRAVDAVRRAIAAWEVRSSGASSAGPTSTKVVGTAARRGATATPASDDGRPQGSGAKKAPAARTEAGTRVAEQRAASEAKATAAGPISAPDAATWTRLASGARSAVNEGASSAELDAFVATLAARLGSVDLSAPALREAVDAAWSTSGAERVGPSSMAGSSARLGGRYAAGITSPTDVGGSTRAMAFGDRVVSLNVPEVLATPRGAAPMSAEGYATLDGFAERTFLETFEGEASEAGAPGRPPSTRARRERSSAPGRDRSPAPGSERSSAPGRDRSTVATRAKLVSALSAAAESAPATLTPKVMRRATDWAAQIASGRALSSAEARAVVAALESAGLQVPPHAARALQAAGVASGAAPSIASTAFSRAEAWQSLPALRTSVAAGPSERSRATAPGSAVMVDASAGTEGLRFPAAERISESSSRLGGNLGAWLGQAEDGPGAAMGASAQVVPALAGRTMALAGWTTISDAGLAPGTTAASREGDYPEAAQAEWLRLEGVETEVPGDDRRAAAGERRERTTGRKAGRGGSARPIAVPPAARLAGKGAARTVLADGGRALRSLGPNLSRWLAPRPAMTLLPGAAVPTRTGVLAREAALNSAGLHTQGAARLPTGEVGEWLRLEADRSSPGEAAEGRAARSMQGPRATAARSAEPRIGFDVRAPMTSMTADGLSLPMTERIERGTRAMGSASVLSQTWGGETTASHFDVGRLGGNVADMVVLAGEPAISEAAAGAGDAKGASPEGRRARPDRSGAPKQGRSRRDEILRAGSAASGEDAGFASFAPLDATRVAGLRARVGGWLKGVYGATGMSGALSRGKALEGFASLLLGGGTSAEAARAFGLLERGAPLTFLDMAGEGSAPAVPPQQSARGASYRPGTLQPAGRRPQGGVGPTVGGTVRGGVHAGPGTGAGGAYGAQAGADVGAFVETPAAFQREAAQFFAQTAEPGMGGAASMGVGSSGGLGLPLVNPVVNVVSQAASFSMAGGQQAGGPAVREEVTTSVERVSKGREDSEKELRKILPELVEVLRRRMRTERERRGLL